MTTKRVSMSISEILQYLVKHGFMTSAAADDIIDQIFQGKEE